MTLCVQFDQSYSRAARTLLEKLKNSLDMRARNLSLQNHKQRIIVNSKADLA